MILPQTHKVQLGVMLRVADLGNTPVASPQRMPARAGSPNWLLQIHRWGGVVEGIGRSG